MISNGTTWMLMLASTTIFIAQLVGCGYSIRLLTWPFLSVYAARLYSLIKPVPHENRIGTLTCRFADCSMRPRIR
jgi:hypothetical protein